MKRFFSARRSVCVLLGGLIGLSVNHDAAADTFPEPLSVSDFVDGGQPDSAKVELGRQLFFDPILSGNRNISCATCHHPNFATADGLSLPIGEGGRKLGPKRTTGDEVGEPVHERVPRNAPAIFALGHKDVKFLFHDGRVSIKSGGGFTSPAGSDLLPGLENILAVQAMFPVTSATEMAGQAGENAVADAAAAGDLPLIWELLGKRVNAIDDYRDQIVKVFNINPSEITFAHIANAIAAFEIDIWRAANTNFDQFLKMRAKGMPPAHLRKKFDASMIRGANLFYGDVGCSNCHSGPLFSDMQFHAIAAPQVGPGKGQGEDGIEDLGRGAVSGNISQNYAFRTPPLRNVAFTAPYMHDGAYKTLASVVRHHADTLGSLEAYRCGIEEGELVLPSRPDLDALDCVAHVDELLQTKVFAANSLPQKKLSENDIKDLVAFLKRGLTDDKQIRDLKKDFPKGCKVPSGLPIDGC